MNPELILSFFLMQGLSPAGTSVPVEAILTSADAMPAWARFTFQVFVIQRLQDEVNNCKAELEECKKHHHDIDEESEALRKEIRVLLSNDKVVKELLKEPDVPSLRKLLVSQTD